MARDTEDIGADKLAIAEQVIVSAGNILTAAGFDRAQIEAFFRQAADHLASGYAKFEFEQSGSGAAEENGASDLRSDFRDIAPVRALATLARQAGALGRPDECTETAKDRFDLAMKMVPHIADAQNWLRRSAEAAGLSLAANRHEAIETAPRNESKCGSDKIFLDDFEAEYKQSFDFIRVVADALVDQRDEDAFLRLLVALVDGGISVTSDLKGSIEEGVRIFGPQNTFID